MERMISRKKQLCSRKTKCFTVMPLTIVHKFAKRIITTFYKNNTRVRAYVE